MGMGSRDTDRLSPHHQPLLSSLVVRPSDGDGGDVDVDVDYEAADLRREPPPLPYRSDRYSDDRAGYRLHAGSISPVRHRDEERRYSPDLDHTPRSQDIGSRREFGRYRDSSPPYPRGRGGGRPFSRGPGGPWLGPRPLRGEEMLRNNPNVRPREGDWYCSDPSCGNLNFARREHCNNCHQPRYGRRGSPPRRGSLRRSSPRRGYHALPPPYVPSRRFPGPPPDRSPIRPTNGFRLPPRLWTRDGPRDFAAGGAPPLRHEVRISGDYPRRDRHYLEDDYQDRSRLDRLSPVDWSHHDRITESTYLTEPKSFTRSPLSPPLPPAPIPPSHARWARDVRERSRSPMRGGLPPKEYHRDLYTDRVRDDRHSLGRDRLGGAY